MDKINYIELYYLTKKIRLVEEAIASRYPEWKMRCPTHLCIGQEAVSAAVGLALNKNDFVVSTHRSHGHYLAKGGDLNKMLAEIYGKSTGCSAGKGGSMHLIDQDVGFMGSTAIVGGSIPIGVGLGLSIKLKDTKQISCIFLGDGAVEEGVFYESINFTAIKKLPVLFICENNFYSVYSPLSVRQPRDRRIFQMVQGIGVKSFNGDGNDVIKIYSEVTEAIETIRSGQGPIFFEFSTYRWREHCGYDYDNDIGYRTEEEFLEWKKRDPVKLIENYLLNESKITISEIKKIEERINTEIEEGFRFAENSPFPSSEDVFSDLYK